MKTISIDSSSLNNVVRADLSAEDFFKTLESSDIVLHVPSDCLMEIAGGKWIHDPDRKLGALYRLESFVTLTKKFYDEGKIRLNQMPHIIIQTEVENPEIRHATVGTVKGANIALFDIERHKQIHTTVAEVSVSRNEAKSAAKLKDEEVKASKIISSIDAGKYLKSFKATQADSVWRDFLHSQFTKWIFGEKVSFDAFNAILENGNCGVTIAFINLLLVHYLAIFLDENSCGEDLKVLIEIGENSLPDILIASMAAYSDYFICDDINLKARCNFLKSLGLVKFQTITLDEFIDMSKSATATILN